MEPHPYPNIQRKACETAIRKFQNDTIVNLVVEAGCLGGRERETRGVETAKRSSKCEGVKCVLPMLFTAARHHHRGAGTTQRSSKSFASTMFTPVTTWRVHRGMRHTHTETTISCIRIGLGHTICGV